MTELQAHLFSVRDPAYALFSASLMPNVPREAVIGVRVPLLRRMAKKLSKAPEAENFLNTLPHTYHEENLLHAFLIEGIRNFDVCIQALDAFLPYVTNWAVCDSLSPKLLGQHKAMLLTAIDRWLSSSDAYTVRFGIKMLMTWFLDADFSPTYLQKVASVTFEDYYVSMMVAWYFATALAKQWDAALPYLTEHRLSPWVHSKTIRKAIESYRISPEQKAFLRTL